MAPEVGVIGEHEKQVLVVLTGDHGVAPADAAREQRHAFVLHGTAVEGDGAEVQEVRGFQELRQDGAAVVGGVSRVVNDAAIVLDEADETGVFHAVALIGGDGENDPPGHRDRGVEVDFVV